MDSEILDTPPPHDLDAERQVIGSILLDPPRLDEVGNILRPDDFHADRAVKTAIAYLAMVDPTANVPPPFGATDAAFDFFDTAPPADPLRPARRNPNRRKRACRPDVRRGARQEGAKGRPTGAARLLGGCSPSALSFPLRQSHNLTSCRSVEWVDAVPIEEALSALGSAQLRNDPAGQAGAIKRLRRSACRWPKCRARSRFPSSRPTGQRARSPSLAAHSRPAT